MIQWRWGRFIEYFTRYSTIAYIFFHKKLRWYYHNIFIVGEWHKDCSSVVEKSLLVWIQISYQRYLGIKFLFFYFFIWEEIFFFQFYMVIWRLDSNIDSKASNNTYLNIIKIFNKLSKKLNIIESRNLIITST